MKPDRLEIQATRRRLPGRTERRGSRLGLPTWGGILFGAVFFVVGGAIVLVGAKVLPVDPAGVHAPFWVLTVFGAVFAAGGMMIWGMTWRQHAANRRRRELARRQPDEPALADYAWNPQGFGSRRWRRAGAALGSALFLTVFLSLFNWWAFVKGGPWLLKIGVALFDLIAVAVWANVIIQFGRAMKFGNSRIEFLQFPYRVGQPVVLRWRAASSIERAQKGAFTLRCVEEWFETTGRGKHRSTHLVQEEICAATWHFDQPRTFPLGADVELRCGPLPGARATALSAERPVFWELEVDLDLPGFDFKETYLVPVYGEVAPNPIPCIELATAQTSPPPSERR